jgi:DNA polymerase-3 subunit epsilon
MRAGQTQAAGFTADTLIVNARYVVFDTEFTSFDRKTNRLLSVGAFRMDGPKILLGEQFYRVLNPGVEVPAETIVVHKLRPHDVMQGDVPHEALSQFREFVSGSVLVGHFVRLDLEIIRKELSATGHHLENPAVCTAEMYRWLVKQGRHAEVDTVQRLENADLGTLAKHFDIEFKETHHALDDAFATAQLWQKLIHELDKHQVRTLGELFKIAC